MKLVELERGEWPEVLASIPALRENQFLREEYHACWEEHENARPICLYAERDGTAFIYPFFVKSAPFAVGGRTWQYMFTAYGYGGLACSSPSPDEADVATLNAAIDDWCRDHEIVSEFVRQDHMSPQRAPLRDLRYATARYDLLALGDGAAHLPEHALRPIRAARAQGLSVERCSAAEGWRDFASLYDQTMERLGAAPFYRLSPHYFECIAARLGERSEILFVRDAAGRRCAALLSLLCGRHWIFHLAGSTTEGMALRANDLLYFEGVQRAHACGYDAVLLGGGRSGDARDSLYRFKSKYANWCVRFLIGTKVHRPDVQQALVQSWAAKYPSKVATYGHFVQCYDF